MTTFAPRIETVEAWGGRFDLRFQVAGSGPALVYLAWRPRNVLGRFSAEPIRQVHGVAPVFPGTDPVDTMSIHQVDDIFDVVLAYEGALSFAWSAGRPGDRGIIRWDAGCRTLGGFPRSVRSGDPFRSRRPLVGVRAMGFGFHQHATGEHSRAAVQQSRRAGTAADVRSPSPEQALDVAVNTIWAMGCVAKFLWPLPIAACRSDCTG